ncbi:MAG: site-specific DNA-methyltransferase [Chloroflexi bacterium]|nr:site-specific DNA-methyltransferase [Chloroflexota bacterium]
MNEPKVNELYQGDCLELMRGWPDHSFDHCITDPPFNMSKKKGLGWAFSSHVTMQEQWDIFTDAGYLEFTAAWIREVSRLVKPNGNTFIFGSYHNIYQIGHILHQLDLRIINSIIWFKPNAQPNITGRTLTESTEQIIWACNNTRDKAKKWVFNYWVAKELGNGRQLRNMWELPYTPKSEKKYGKHPAQKPEALLERLILIGTNENDLILDCFAGTGTTGVVAERLGRRWVMVEKDPTYVEIAQRRIEHPRLSAKLI